ncbi:hypothetical protein T492DRAFT_989553, partial [Pavlovales sp. CCMP2436]
MCSPRVVLRVRTPCPHARARPMRHEEPCSMLRADRSLLLGRPARLMCGERFCSRKSPR